MTGSERGPLGGSAGLVLLTVLVGVATAAGVWLFKHAIRIVEWLAHGWLVPSWGEVGNHWVLLAPVVGGLVVGILLHLRSLPVEPKPAVTEVIEAVTLDEHPYPAEQTPDKTAVAAISVGSGAALGPEDPSVDIGGGIGAWLSRRWGLPHDQLRTLIAAGSAAGLCAAFHAPFAATAFAVEVYSLRLWSRATALTGLATLTSFLVMRYIYPPVEPKVPEYTLLSAPELALCLGVGLLGGLVSAGQIHLVHGTKRVFLRARAVPHWLRPVIGGVILSAVALKYPDLLGKGYDSLEKIVTGQRPQWAHVGTLMLGKAGLMAVSFGSGFIGGFFAPVLYIGAAMGATYGLIAARMLPGLELTPAAFGVVGMAAVLAGCIRAPFAAGLLLLELSNGYRLVPALAIGSLIAWWVSRALVEPSLYTYDLEPADRQPGHAAGTDPARGGTTRPSRGKG